VESLSENISAPALYTITKRMYWLASKFAEAKTVINTTASTFTKNLATEEIEQDIENDRQKHLEEELISVGITKPLLEFVENICQYPKTFVDFPVEESFTPTPQQMNSKTDISTPTVGEQTRSIYILSPWQEQHARLILHQVKDLQKLRFKLCPSHLKEDAFWRIYFLLVRNYISRDLTKLPSPPTLEMTPNKESHSSKPTPYSVTYFGIYKSFSILFSIKGK